MDHAPQTGGVEAVRRPDPRRLYLTVPAMIWSFSKRKPLGAAGAVVILAVAFAAITVDVIAPFGFSEINPIDRLQGPSWKHLFGTDDLGRDTFSRVLHGTRVSLMVGVASVAAGIVHGALWGLASGYIGGKFDMVVQRIMDAIMSVPLLLMAMVVVTVLGSGIQNVILALGFVLTPIASRVVRADVFSAKEQMYVEAARAIGSSPSGISSPTSPLQSSCWPRSTWDSRSSRRHPFRSWAWDRRLPRRRGATCCPARDGSI